MVLIYLCDLCLVLSIPKDASARDKNLLSLAIKSETALQKILWVLFLNPLHSRNTPCKKYFWRTGRSWWLRIFILHFFLARRRRDI